MNYTPEQLREDATEIEDGASIRKEWHAHQLRAHAAALETIAKLERDLAALKPDAERWRWWKANKRVSLTTDVFGNGCVNKTMADVEGYTDDAIDSARGKP